MRRTLRRGSGEWLAVAVVLSGCAKSQTEAAPAPMANGSAAAQPTPAAPAAPLVTVAAGHGDVTFGSDAIAIGALPLHIGSDTSLGAVALSMRGNIIVAEDTQSVRTWDLTSGQPLKVIPPIDDNPAAQTPQISLANDGSALAIGSTKQVRVMGKRDINIGPCIVPGAFSHDAKQLVCLASAPLVWNVVDNKLVAKAPDRGTIEMVQAAQFTADDKTVVWATHHELVRWDFDSGKMATVYTSTNEMTNVVFAAGGAHAFVSSHPSGSRNRTAAVVELATGKATTVGDALTGAVSADGVLVALVQSGEVRVLEVATKKVVWFEKAAIPVQRLAFASDGDSLAYVEGGRIHVFNGKAARTYDAPSRFAGWVAEGVIATQRAGTLEQVTLEKQVWSALDKAPAVDRVDGAPAWATWQASGIAAEPRSGGACAARLRVWTARGGDKTLKAACPEDAPGWVLGDGWAVAVAKMVATVFNATTGKSIGTLAVDKPRIDKPEYARELVAGALAPSALALMSRGPELPEPGTSDPREDVLHQTESGCRVDLTGSCWNDFVVRVYSLDKTARVSWRIKVTNDRPTELAAQASGAIAFDHSGKRVLIGTIDGAIEIASSPTERTVKRLHFARIVRIVVSPGDGWVFSEDAAGVQRVWKLP